MMMQTNNSQLSKVLPKHILLRVYNQPYDPLWFKILAIDPAILIEWNENISRWKVNDLVRMGALKAGDEFVIPVVASNGEKEDFHVTVCRNTTDCYPISEKSRKDTNRLSFI